MKRPLVSHPFLFALYPILFLFVHNITEVRSINTVILPSLVGIMGTFVLWRLLILVLKDEERSGLVAAVIVLLFFSYGHFSALVRDLELFGVMLRRNRYRALAYVLLGAPIVYYAARARINLLGVTKALNISGVCLFVILSIQIGYHYIHGIKLADTSQHDDAGLNRNIDGLKLKGKSSAKKPPPDIYYIILDGYASSRTLSEIYGYPNAEFVSELVHKGFFVARNSTSNYAMTSVSLTSSFNMSLFESKAEFDSLKNKNEVQAFLKAKGYKVIILDNENNGSRTSSAMDFWIMLLQTSMVDMIAHRVNLYGDLVREDVLGDFRQLTRAPGVRGPKFVFAHILSPHPPYVFGRNGERVTWLNSVNGMWDLRRSSWDNKEAYLDQLTFISKKAEEAVDVILSKSERPPIIILQGDHGPQFSAQESDLFKIRMGILNAYYLPDGGQELLYSSITPVNTFRIIFNYYLDAHYGLLPDENYFSTIENPYDLTKVTDILQDKQN